MFKNYILALIRNVRQHPVYFFINLLGLSVGITCCMLILMFVRHELSFDDFHANKERLYRIDYDITMGGSRSISPSVPVFVGPYVKRSFPEIEDASRFERAYSPVTVRAGDDRMFDESGFAWADSNLFRLLSFKAL